MPAGQYDPTEQGKDVEVLGQKLPKGHRAWLVDPAGHSRPAAHTMELLVVGQ